MVLRYLFAGILGFLVTFGLFYMMQYLIAAGDLELDRGEKRIRVDLGDVRDIQEVREIERKPDIPVPEAIPDTEIQMEFSIGNVGDTVNFSAQTMEVENVSTGLGRNFVPDGEYLPIVRVPPQYPARAAEKELEGFVTVVFTVTPMGSTANVKVVESSDRLFERNAIRAAQRFKYKPKVVDGKEVFVEGVRTTIEFKLAS